MNNYYIDKAMLSSKRRRRLFRKKAAKRVGFAETLTAFLGVAGILGVAVTTIFALAFFHVRGSSQFVLAAIAVLGVTMVLLLVSAVSALLSVMADGGKNTDKDLERCFRGAFALLLLRIAKAVFAVFLLSVLVRIFVEIPEFSGDEVIFGLLSAAVIIVIAAWLQFDFAALYIYRTEKVSMLRAFLKSAKMTSGRRFELLFLRITSMIYALGTILSFGLAAGVFVSREARVTLEYSKYLAEVYSFPPFDDIPDEEDGITAPTD